MNKMRKNNQTFINELQIIFGDAFDYSKVEYKSARAKVELICKFHGSIFSLPTNLLKGHGCDKCARQNSSLKRSGNSPIFIEKSNKIHNNFYDYSLVEYKNCYTKVSIICPKHNKFEQSPSGHLSGHGCPICRYEKMANKLRSNTEKFIIKARIIHNNKYNYSLVDYNGNADKIKIICNKHKSAPFVFSQTPSDHLSGSGCPVCIKIISYSEIDWLNSLNIPIEYRQYPLNINGKSYKVDGFDPNTNTVYEFYGDYWHGNPVRFNKNDINHKAHKTYGELYLNTVAREQNIKLSNYNLISVWEHDWILNRGISGK